MSQENIDFVRSLYAAWERGDFSSVEWAHPDIEYVVPDGPAPGAWTGVAGMREAYLGFLSVWEDLRTSAEEFHELDDERVLVFFRFSGGGRNSGFKLEQMDAEGAALFHIRAGKVTRHVVYSNRERALADLGLSQQDGQAEL